MPTGVYIRTEENKINIGKAQMGEKNHQWGKRYIITPVNERFWKYVEKTETCWIWVGKSKSGNGYGQIKIKGKKISAHRFSYELHKGEIPKGEGYHGICVLHTCDNRLCVNPEHLWLGTNADNIHDMERKGRSSHPNKESHGMSKFTLSDIRNIRKKYETGKFSYEELSQEFKTSKSNMASIVTNKTWKI